MKLLGNTVLLEPLPTAKKSSGGIFLCSRYQDDRMQWKVVAVGPGRRLKNGTMLPPECKPGDLCLCQADSGNRYKFPDGSVIVNASQIEMIWLGPSRPQTDS